MSEPCDWCAERDAQEAVRQAELDVWRNTQYFNEPGFRLLDSAHNPKNGSVDRTHGLVSDDERRYDVAVRLWTPDCEENPEMLVYRTWLFGVGCSHLVQNVADGTLLGYTVDDSGEAESWRRMREHIQKLGMLG
jgi:hypothetical protein